MRTHPRIASIGIAAGLMLAAAAFTANAGTRAKPYPAWAKPKIHATMSVAQAKQLVAERTAPQTKWVGPTSGPQAPKSAQHLVYMSADQSYVSFVNWGQGIVDAANQLGWSVDTLNGRGTISGQLKAMQQAVSMHPAAIITSADAHGLQGPIRQAVRAGIPVIGIHAAAFPGPDPSVDLYDNITSNPAEIGRLEAAYVIAASNGKARDLHLLDNSFSIARFKAKATYEPIKHCSGCKFLGEVNVPIADTSSRIPSTISGLLANHGDSWYMTTCCDNFYPYVASALKSSNASPAKIHLVGSDGPPSAYNMIRKGDFEVATVPEPSTLFGYQAVDAIVRAMAGKPPSHYVNPAYLVDKDNVEAEGGDKNQFIPSNHFACHYLNIWRGLNKPCT